MKKEPKSKESSERTAAQKSAKPSISNNLTNRGIFRTPAFEEAQKYV